MAKAGGNGIGLNLERPAGRLERPRTIAQIARQNTGQAGTSPASSLHRTTLITVIAGADDVQFCADLYAPLLKRVRPDVEFEIVAGFPPCWSDDRKGNA